MTMPMDSQALDAGNARVKGRSLWQDARSRLLHNKAALASLCILFVVVCLADRRADAEPLRARRGRLRFDRPRPRSRQRPSLRHGPSGPRSLSAHHVRRADLPDDRARRHACEPPHRRHLRRGGGLSRRPYRYADDARRRHSLFPALHLFRDHPDGRFRPEYRPDLRRARGGRVAYHGADRARTDHGAQGTGFHRSRASPRAPRRRQSSGAISCQTCSAR